MTTPSEFLEGSFLFQIERHVKLEANSSSMKKNLSLLDDSHNHNEHKFTTQTHLQKHQEKPNKSCALYPHHLVKLTVTRREKSLKVSLLLFVSCLQESRCLTLAMQFRLTPSEALASFHVRGSKGCTINTLSY